MTTVVIEHNGDGAINKLSSTDTAFPHRDFPYNLLITSLWADRSDDERNVAWTRDLATAMGPFSSGSVYVNYLGSEGDERIRSAYGANYDRLAAVKKAYDPDNSFRLNQNIAPS
jgi:FAD/FMN-containing dehydrogenase